MGLPSIEILQNPKRKITATTTTDSSSSSRTYTVRPQVSPCMKEATGDEYVIYDFKLVYWSNKTAEVCAAHGFTAPLSPHV